MQSLLVLPASRLVSAFSDKEMTQQLSHNVLLQCRLQGQRTSTASVLLVDWISLICIFNWHVALETLAEIAQVLCP